MRVLDKLLLKQDVDKELMRSKINCSMLESTSNSDGEKINTGVYKPTRLEPTIKIINERKITLTWGSTEFGKEGTKYIIKNNPNVKIYTESNKRLLKI